MFINGINIHTPNPQQGVFYGPGQGPFIPPLQDCPAFLQPFLLGIAGMVVNAVTAGVNNEGRHAGRVMLYNQLYANNFQNTDFVMTCSAVIDNYILGAYNREWPMSPVNPEVFNTCVARSLALMGAYNIGKYPSLRQHVPDMVVSEGLQLAQTVNQSMQIVTGLKVQLNNPQQQHQPQMGFIPAAQPGYPSYNPPMHQPGFATATSNGGPIGNPNAMFTMPGNHSPAGLNTPHASDRHQSLVNSGNANLNRHQPQVTNTPVIVVNQAPVVEAEPTLAQWTPSNVQAHPHAYLADTEILSARIAMDPINQIKVVIAQIQPKPTGEKDMDRQRHQITSGYNANPDQLSGEGLAEASGNVLATQAKEVILKSEFFAEPDDLGGQGVVLSLDEAVFKAQHKLMVETHGKDKGKAVTAGYLAAIPVITRGTYRGVLESIFKCTNCEGLAAQLRRIKSSGDNNEQSHLVDQLDAYITREFNHFVRDKLSLPLNLDSFMDDAPGVTEYMNKKFGQVYGDAYTEYQKTFLTKIFTPMEQAVYDNIIYTVIDPRYSAEPREGDDNPPPYTTAVFQLITVTAVGLTGKELNVGLLKEHSGVLTSDRFPGLLTYAKAVHKASNEEHPVAHHYIVTSDCQVYEVHQGLIGLGQYLISQVK